MKRLIALLLLATVASSAAADAAGAKKKLQREGRELTVDDFHKSIFLGEAKIVALYLEAGMPADAPSDKGVSALHVAARDDHPKILEMLLKAGGDANTAAPDGDTPLCEAADAGPAKSVELLIKAGADVNARCSYQKTALFHAVDDGDAAKVRLLLAAGADPGYTVRRKTMLDWARERKNTEVIALLEKAKAPAPSGDPIAELKRLGIQSPTAEALFESVDARDTKAVALLLAAGVRTDVRDETGRPPLWNAIENHDLAMVKTLLAAGANPNDPGQHVRKEFESHATLVMPGGRLRRRRDSSRPSRCRSEARRGQRLRLERAHVRVHVRQGGDGPGAARG